MASEGLLERVTGSLFGVYLGDRLGEPWETQSSRRASDIVDLPLGGVTDDWRLTAAVVRSLCRRRAFDPLDQALIHMEEAALGTDRWGRTTINGIREMREYLDSRGREGRSPFDPAATAEPGRGRGNGVAMRITGLVAWRAATSGGSPHPSRPLWDPVLQDAIFQLGGMTHPDKAASAAAYGLGISLLPLLSPGPGMASSHLGPDVPKDVRASFLLVHVCNETAVVPGGREFSDRLRRLLDLDLLFGGLDELRSEVGSGCDSLESVPFAIALFLRNFDDFRSTMVEAVAAGGDTDTVAAMAGSLSGAVAGRTGIPREWVVPSVAAMPEPPPISLAVRLIEAASPIPSSPSSPPGPARPAREGPPAPAPRGTGAAT